MPGTNVQFYIVLVIFLINLFKTDLTIAGDTLSTRPVPLTVKIIGLNPKKKNDSGFNIKFSPAIFWRTLVIETEMPLHPRFSVGVNLYGKLGGTDAKKKFTQVEKEAYYKPGFAAELSLKCYIIGDAPEGFYAHLNGGYSTLFYQDGNTRPYVLHNHWRKFDGSVFQKPQPYYAGAGIGYQLILLPEHLIANVLAGVQWNNYQNSYIPLSLYILPSIGYKF